MRDGRAHVVPALDGQVLTVRRVAHPERLVTVVEAGDGHEHRFRADQPVQELLAG
jgi:hypothetical protein